MPASREKELHSAGLIIAASITSSRIRLSTDMEKSLAGRFPRQVWLRIAPNDGISAYIRKSEMGQGVCTSLPMIVADELEADFGRVRFETSLPGTEYKDPQWGVQMTGGSTSVRHMFMPLKKGGRCRAREMLIKAAAGTWDVPADECETENSTVRHVKSGRSLSYGALSRAATALTAPQNPRPFPFAFITALDASWCKLEV